MDIRDTTAEIIYAKGMKNGLLTEVSAKKKRGEWYFLFNGEINARLDSELLDAMETPHLLGGTKAPQNDIERLAAVLEGYFFDKAPEEVQLPFSIEPPQEDEVNG